MLSFGLSDQCPPSLPLVARPGVQRTLGAISSRSEFA